MLYRGSVIEHVSYFKCHKNIIMKVPQKILILTFSAILANNGNSIIVMFGAPALDCIFYDTWPSDIFFCTSSSTRAISTLTMVDSGSPQLRKTKSG